MTTTTEQTITDYDAIAAKAANPDHVRLHKYADPIEDAREDISIEDAREIAREDASLIYATIVDGCAIYEVHDDCGGDPWTPPIIATDVASALDAACAQIRWDDYAPLSWTDGDDDPETSVDVTVYVSGPDGYPDDQGSRTVTVYAPGHEQED